MNNEFINDFDWTSAQIAQYQADGFIVVEDVAGEAFADRLKDRYSKLFAGHFETGTNPDNFPVQVDEGDMSPVTRWMTNPWRADYTIANFALHPTVGKLIARLNGWSGMRLLQNNVHWKTPGAPALSMHQDTSYHLWCEPADLSSCWVALSDTQAEGGTLLFARGSHLWPRIELQEYRERIAAKNLEGFLDPSDFQTFVRESAVYAGVRPEFVPIEVPKGGAAFFHGWVWHGSDANRSTQHRYSISSHGVRPETCFAPDVPANVFGRYKRFNDAVMDEAYFPVLWTEKGYRTPGMEDFAATGSGARLVA
jgi:ectoine hydroxylase-related dioxygenase (phytanoyl-CoA dioxygenase family)